MVLPFLRSKFWPFTPRPRRPPAGWLTKNFERPCRIDQFEAREVERDIRQINSRFRRPEVRSAVLARTEGKCELCGKLGFVTANGAYYLETHHVVPLSELGPDEVWNVVGICPDEHRKAHYGVEALELRYTLIEVLTTLYPGVAERLRNWNTT